MPTEALFDRIAPSGDLSPHRRGLADETPLAIELNGIGYAVLMTTAQDLEDLAFGFACSERLIENRDQLIDVDLHAGPHGSIMRITLAAEMLPRIHDRVRHRTSESSCGMCGLENLEQAMRPLPRLASGADLAETAIFSALAALADRQPMNCATGAVHAAALCSANGDILLVREDVGRHNAFDKLVGAMLRRGLRWEGGFGLLTSRCSYELVEKAVLSGCPTLVTISAPTSLAAKRARDANLRLYTLARPDSVLRLR